MFAALLLLGTAYASYTIPVAERPCPVMQYGFDENTTFAPNVRVDLPAFDTSLGVLYDIEIIFNFQQTWAYRAENTNILPTSAITWSRSMQMNLVYRPSFYGPVEWDGRNTVGDRGVSLTAAGSWNPLTSFDGVSDWSGTSGFDANYGLLYTTLVVAHPNSPIELWYWGLPGTKSFYISPRMLDSQTSGFPGHWQSESDIRLNLGSSVSVLYHYQ